MAASAQRQGREHYWLAAADEATNAAARVTALQEAWHVYPTNPSTAYALGEYYRLVSWQGKRDYEYPAYEAMKWFAMSMALDRYYFSM